MLSEFGETWLKSSTKITLQGKDSIELNAHALSKYWQVWKALASDRLESMQRAKLLQKTQKFRCPEKILIQKDANRGYYLFYDVAWKKWPTADLLPVFALSCSTIQKGRG